MYEQVTIKSIETGKPEYGHSKPIRIKGNDNRIYYLKSKYSRKNDMDEDASALQEYISYELAKQLNILVPNYKIINVNDKFIEDNKKVGKVGKVALKKGKYFASEIVPNATTAPTSSDKKDWKIFLDGLDPQIFADLIVFNIYISNKDFFINPTNLITSARETGEKNLYAIDFGASFVNPFLPSTDKIRFNRMSSTEKPNNFQIDKTTALNAYIENPNSFRMDLETAGNTYVLNFLANKLSYETNPFNNMVKKIENIKNCDIEEILCNAPGEWFTKEYENEDKEVYINFLKKNKYKVKDVIENMVRYNLLGNAPIIKEENLDLGMKICKSRLKW